MASGKIETLSKRVTVNGIIDHAKLINKHLDNQHPISAISGLQEELNKLKSGTTQQVDDLNKVVEQARLDLQKTAVAIQKESATKVELNNAETSLKAELNDVETEIKGTLKDTEAELKEDLKEVQTSLKSEITSLDDEFSEKLESLKELSDNKYSTKAEFVTLSNMLTSVVLEVDEDMTDLQKTTTDQLADLQRNTTEQITDLQEATTEQITTLKETSNTKFLELQEDLIELQEEATSQVTALREENNTKFSNLQEELDNRFEEVGTKITTDIQPKLDNLAIDISTVETNLSNTSNIYHTKTAEAEAVPLDEVLAELYQGSGNAKNITYTSGEDEKPLNEVIDELYQGSGNAKNITYTKGEAEKPLDEVIDELYQGSGSAENISYTKDKTVHTAISDLETNLGAAAAEADKQFEEIDDRLNTVLEYINTLHPLTITVSKGSSTTKHFSDSGDISVEWKTNRGIGESTMVFSDAVDSATCSPKNAPTSPAEAVIYAHTWSPYNIIKDTLTQASVNGKAEAQAKISIAGLNIEKSISCTYTHYVYCGMLNKPFGDIDDLAQSIIASLSTNNTTRFLQTTGSLSNKTYKATTGGGYLYYVAPISYVAGKTLVVDFGIGKTYLDTYNTTATLKFGDLNVEYAVYQITNDLQNGDVTAAISVQN